jgi:hypothetical protein
MTEVGIAEYFGMAEALGIIATLFVILYFSRKQMQSLSVDIETKILNDLDERIHGITQMGVERPELIKVLSNKPADYSSPDVPFAYHILYTLAHVFHMRQRGVVSDNEWNGWLRWMKSAFQQGTIAEIWQRIEVEKWFDPAFQEFINKELTRGVKSKK